MHAIKHNYRAHYETHHKQKRNFVNKNVTHEIRITHADGQMRKKPFLVKTVQKGHKIWLGVRGRGERELRILKPVHLYTKSRKKQENEMGDGRGIEAFTRT